MKIRKTYRFFGGMSVLAMSIALFAFAVLPTIKPAHALGQVYTVTNTGDNGGVNPAPGANTGTLRQAIVDANANATLLNGEPHNIQFNIPGTGVQTIALQTALPQITRPTIIDGTTQAGTTCGNLVADTPGGNGTPHALNIEVVSSDQVTGGGAWSVTLSFASTTTGSGIRGVVLNGILNDDSKDIVVQSSNMTVDCSYLGVKPDGVTPFPASYGAGLGGYGIAGNNGASGFTLINTLIANHQMAINADGTTTNPTNGWTLKNNLFGVSVNGTVVNSSVNGIPFLNYFSNLQVGGTAADANVFGGATGGRGIWIGWSNNVTLESNYFGVTPAGQNVPNTGDDDIVLCGSTNVLVGTSGKGNIMTNANNGVMTYGGASDITIQDNVIYGNVQRGLLLQGGNYTIIGNTIGLKPDGVTPAPNQTGIRISGGQFTIGDGTVAGRNVIAGNTGDAINVSGTLGAMSYVKGNYMGLDKNGHAAANGGVGFNSNADNITLGGSAPGEGNLFGLNGRAIDWGGTNGNPRFVYGNQIGFEADGETPTKNTTDTAIIIQGSSPLQFGGPNAGEGNRIGNVVGSAIAIRDMPNGKIQGNTFGLTKSGQPAPISWAGIWVGGTSSDLIIGGNTQAAGNVITNFGDYGVDIVDSISGTTIQNNDIHSAKADFAWQIGGGIYLGSSSSNNTITLNKIHDNASTGIVIASTAVNNSLRQNSIYANTTLGIDLGGDGVTANDLLDSDTGPNNLQNYPVITASMTNCDGTTDTRNIPMFNSTPNTTFTIDYYANPSWNPNGTAPRQGEQWVSSETVTTDADGNASLNLSLINSITYPSVTATDPQGNTSEFGSINTMKFTECQGMSRSVNSTTNNFLLSASWTGINIPVSYYRNQPQYPADYNNTTGQYNDRIETAGLTLTITVNGQPFILSSPPQWISTYTLGNPSWIARGHLANQLPEGQYDVTITVTDALSNLSMTHTYTKGLTVDNTRPILTYTTPFTVINNQKPDLTFMGSEPLVDDRGLVVCDATKHVTTQQIADYYLYGAIANPGCRDISVHAATVGTAQDSTRMQTTPDSYKIWQDDGTGNWVEVDTPLAEGTYDVFMTGADNAGNYSGTFTSYFDSSQGVWVQSGTPYVLASKQLIVDMTAPTGTITSPTTTGVLSTPGGSPVASGTVNDPSAMVMVTLTTQDPAYPTDPTKVITSGPFLATVNPDGTWSLPAGTIQPSLTTGTYTIRAVFVDPAGNSTTTTQDNALTITPAVLPTVTPLPQPGTSIPNPTGSGTILFDPTKPVITGTYEPSTSEGLKVNVAGVWYVLGTNTQLTTKTSPTNPTIATWTLDLTTLATPLTPGTYNVVVQSLVAGEQVLGDSTTNELIIPGPKVVGDMGNLAKTGEEGWLAGGLALVVLVAGVVMAGFRRLQGKRVHFERY